MSKLIWAPPSTHAGVWKNPPEILLAALQPRQLLDWRKQNTWADNLEMIVFTDDVPPAATRIEYLCAAFAPMTGQVPHLCVNCPPDAMRRMSEIKSGPYTDDDVGAALRYKHAVNAVGGTLRGIRCAWIQPESDHSTGALALAQTLGFVVAYSQKPMIDAIGALGAGQMGVNVLTYGRIKASEWTS